MSRREMLDAYGKMLFDQATPDFTLNPQVRFARSYLPDDKGARILDGGCGSGGFARTFAKEGYSQITGVDLHDHVDTEELFEYRCTSLDETGLADGCCDFVYSFSVIYHLPDPATGFREFWRVMKPGASLVFSAHTRYSLFTLDRRIRRALGGAPHLAGVRFYSAGEYIEMLRTIGFEVLDVDGFQLNYFANSLPARALGKLWRMGAGGSDRKPPEARASKDVTPRWLKTLRSVAGYHMIIAARKPAGATPESSEQHQQQCLR